MAFTEQRYLINNLADADAITVAAGWQGAGTIRQPKKTGTGTATMTPSGSYTGASNLVYTVQCDGAGTVDTDATFRWRTSDTAAGSWEASGVSATSSPTSLSNGVSVQWSAGTMVANDKWQFPTYAEYGPAKLFKNDRDIYFKSADFGSNLLSNADFESGFTSGLADGWTKAYASQTYADETGTVHSGSHAQKITVVADDEGLGITQAESITSGKEYYIEAWIYASNASTFRFYCGNLDSAASKGVTITAADTWQKVTWHATGSTTGSIAVWFYQGPGDCTTSDYLIIDDIQMVEIPYIDIDLTTAQEITAIALLDFNFTSSAVCILKGNSSEAWVSPGYEKDDFTVSSDPIIEYDGDTYRYWRWVFQDIDNTDGFISVGKMYLGTYSELTGTLKNIPWGSSKIEKLQTTVNQSDAGKSIEYIYAKNASFITQYFPTRTSGDLSTLEGIWDATYDIDTGQRKSILVHFFYDISTDLFLCRCVSNAFTIIYPNYAHYEVSLSWEQEIMTRTI